MTLTQDLNRRFPPDVRADNWKDLEAALGIVLPPLENDGNEDSPHVPRCCDSVMAIAYWIVEHHPERVGWVPVSCERTGKMATHQSSEDEVWAAMCECICDALGVDPEEVTYGARMVEDLGMG